MAKGSSRGSDYMRGFLWGVRGEEVVMANLNEQIAKIKIKTERGLVMAAAYIYNKTETEAPLTPVDTGNMRASWFVTSASKIEKGKNPTFVGKDSGKMTSNHAKTLSTSQATVLSLTTLQRKVVMLGYTANYSGFVHEMIGANFNPENRKGKARRRAGAGPKWLETAIKKNAKTIVQIIAQTSKI